MPRLIIQIPDGEEQVYEFDDPELTIGRGDDNAIPVPHGSLSTHHARLSQTGDGTWTLADLGSTNGTFVNGSQITEALLPDESEILFGQVAAHFSASGAVDEGAQPSQEEAATFSAAPLNAPGRPANFKSISPVRKGGKKKDPAGMVVVVLAVLSILVSLGLAGLALTSLA